MLEIHHNTMTPQPYWYLLDFVVAGEQSGKTLARLFYPLPKRADYFENKFQNMVYDTSTQLLCDYTHIIAERISRFPLRFLQENCPPDMLEIDGVKLEEVYPKHAKDSERKRYFEALGERINNTPVVLNNLKNRLEDGDSGVFSDQKSLLAFAAALPLGGGTGGFGACGRASAVGRVSGADRVAA